MYQKVNSLLFAKYYILRVTYVTLSLKQQDTVKITIGAVTCNCDNLRLKTKLANTGCCVVLRTK